MFATTHFPSAMVRASSVVLVLLQKFLMVAGLVFLVGLIGVQAGHAGLIEGLKTFLPSNDDVVATDLTISDDVAETELVADAAPTPINPKMRRAMDYVSKRYRVSTEALEPIFATALNTGKELRIDPLLIIAVIGVESGFNPFSQSVYGAQGLMQVVPRFHKDKLPEEADHAAFLDPVINVQVGAKVLHDAIRRFGGVEDGLQQFGGAANDPSRRYSLKVLAEKQRLEQAVQQRQT